MISHYVKHYLQMMTFLAQYSRNYPDPLVKKNQSLGLLMAICCALLRISPLGSGEAA